jgi:hypothetical protein
LGGLTNATINGDFDVLAMKVSDSGDEIWTKKVGLAGNDYSIFVEQSEDGGYVLAGYSNSFGNGDDDVYIVKLAPDGIQNIKNIINKQSGIGLWNYPNPFNLSTTITFSVTQVPLDVDIEICNEQGQTIRTFSNLTITKSENQKIAWDGTNQSNQAVTPGSYYAVLKHDGKTLALRKMILIK